MSTARTIMARELARLTERTLPWGALRGALVSATKAAGTGERWAETDPALPRIEARAIREMLAAWSRLRGQVFDLLGLDKRAKAVGAPFKFDPALLAELLLLGELYMRAEGGPDGPLVRAAWAAFLRGIANGASDLDIDALIEQALTLQRQSYEARGLELVRSATGRAYRTRIVSELLSGKYDGMNPLLVARALRKRFDAGDYDWERLARSETAMAQSDGKLEQYRAAGVTVVDYVTAGDSKVSKICRRLADEGPYAIELAPVPVRSSHPNCFPAGTMVHAATVRGSSDRWYEGEFVEIVTASGNLLTVTPNHPILTPQGWVAAHLLHEGGHVIRCLDGERVVATVDPYDHHGPAVIEQVAVTLGTAARVAPVTVPTATEDFHGDGFDANVEIVATTSELHGGALDAALDQVGSEIVLGVTAIRRKALAGDGPAHEAGLAHEAPALGGVGGSAEREPFRRRGALHAQEHGFTASAYGNAALAQSAQQHGAAVTAFERESLEAVAAFVAADEIIEIRNYSAVHRVYNLETAVGWYVAGGIVVHNCRCTILAKE